MPRRSYSAKRGTAASDRKKAIWVIRAGAATAPRNGASHARRLNLRSRPDRVNCIVVRGKPLEPFFMSDPLNAPAPLIPVPRGPLPDVPPDAALPQVEVQIDGKKVSVPENATILDAARRLGIDTPTLCFLENL